MGRYVACLCVCLLFYWTDVGQWVTVTGCGSEVETFWRDFSLCVVIRREGSVMQPHEGADA